MSIRIAQSSNATMAHVLVPGAWKRTAEARWAVNIGLVLAGSIFVALLARLEYFLPGTPVPITGQTLGVVLVGAALGRRLGAAAMAAYLLEGAAGLPVFASGPVGLAHLIGPTAGYLWSYPLVAGLVGYLAERGWDRSPITAGAAMLLGNAVIYLTGLLWLGRFVPSEQVLAAGLYPFVVGDLIKVVLAAAILPAAWSLVGRARKWSER